MSKKYETLARIVISNHAAHGHDPDERHMAIGLIRNGIFDCPAIDSGLVSEKGQHLKKSELTKEHFHPRQASAFKMFEMLDAGATFDDLVAFIKKVCQVNYVTNEENIALKPYQKLGSGYDTWEKQYEAVGIKLVPYVRKKPIRKQKHVYIINDIEYKSSKEAADANFCKIQDVYNRCKSQSKKYVGWIRKEIL